ncbi:MAG: hypothetical protein KUG73_00910, partial [Pseudomonadales bacterium]|nr:hypothetical protein [Pseudomonadales bacterium]
QNLRSPWENLSKMDLYIKNNENLMDKPQANKTFRKKLLVAVAILTLVLSFIQIHSIWKIELNSNPNESIFLVAEKPITPNPA